MKINGRTIKGVKATVGKYNRLPIDERLSFSIWYDHITNEVMLIENDSLEQSNLRVARYKNAQGISFFRYADVSDIINYAYPSWRSANITMSMLRSVLSQYIV